MLEESAVVVATQPPIRKPVSMYPAKKDIKDAAVKELIEQGIIIQP